MIPNSDNYEDEIEENIITDFEIESEPSLTYAMNLERFVFVGTVDETEAVKQAVLKIIHTERYEHDIYSWDYGIELQDLHGKSIPYVMSEIKQRITDALTADDRIETISDFSVERVGKNTLRCNFKVITAQDEEFTIESEVNI